MRLNLLSRYSNCLQNLPTIIIRGLEHEVFSKEIHRIAAGADHGTQPCATGRNCFGIYDIRSKNCHRYIRIGADQRYYCYVADWVGQRSRDQSGCYSTCRRPGGIWTETGWETQIDDESNQGGRCFCSYHTDSGQVRHHYHWWCDKSGMAA